MLGSFGKWSVALLLLFFSVALTGCASFGVWMDEHPETIEVAVTAASEVVFDEKPKWAEPAYTLTSVAISELNGDETATVETIVQFIDQEIEWSKLSDSEVTLLKGFIVAIKVEAIRYLEAHGRDSPGDDEVRIAQVLSWVNAVAKRKMASACTTCQVCSSYG